MSIIYYIAVLPETRLQLLTNKTDKIAAGSFAALNRCAHSAARSLSATSPLAYIIAQLFQLRLFDSLLRSSRDARLTSRITDIQSYARYFPLQKNHIRIKYRCMKMCVNNSTLTQNGKEKLHLYFYVYARVKYYLVE